MKSTIALISSVLLTSTTALADTAAISGWRGHTADFISKGETMSHFIKAEATTTSKPRALGNQNWPGLSPYADKISAAMNLGNGQAMFFLNDGNVLRYNLRRQKIASAPHSMHRKLRGLQPHAHKIKAAFRWNANYAFIFLSDGQYLRYNTTQGRIDDGYPKKISNKSWPGLGKHAKNIDSVVNWGSGKLYVFLNDGRYLLYDKRADRVADGYPRMMSNKTWNQMGNWFADGLKDEKPILSTANCRQLRERRFDSIQAERRFEQCRAKKRQARRLANKLQTIAIDYYGMTDKDFNKRLFRRSDSIASANMRFESKGSILAKRKGILCHTVETLPLGVFTEIVALDLKKSELAMIQKSCNMRWLR